MEVDFFAINGEFFAIASVVAKVTTFDGRLIMYATIY